MNIIIYGAEVMGQRIAKEYQSDTGGGVIAFADGNPEYWHKGIMGIKVIAPTNINDYDFDKIIIASRKGVLQIRDKLCYELKIPLNKVDGSRALKEYIWSEGRNTFLMAQRDIIYRCKMPGNIAEGGVFRGDFAVRLNEYFPERTLYLFDTFSGFDERDMTIENQAALSEIAMPDNVDYQFHKNTSVERVLKRMPSPDKVVVRPGFFPETTAGIDDEFCFVNLDFDLYAPTLAGLNFFYPKMVDGGVILVHDFFSDDFRGVAKAITEFCAKENIHYIGIGDNCSIAILKQEK
jgi:hypothetical protein